MNRAHYDEQLLFANGDQKIAMNYECQQGSDHDFSCFTNATSLDGQEKSCSFWDTETHFGSHICIPNASPSTDNSHKLTHKNEEGADLDSKQKEFLFDKIQRNAPALSSAINVSSTTRSATIEELDTESLDMFRAESQPHIELFSEMECVQVLSPMEPFSGSVSSYPQVEESNYNSISQAAPAVECDEISSSLDFPGASGSGTLYARARRLRKLMKKSETSLSILQTWDLNHGLPKSHSPTMVKTSRSRKQLQEGKILTKWNGAPLIQLDNPVVHRHCPT